MDVESVQERFKSPQPLLHLEGIAILRKLLLAGPVPADAVYSFTLRSLSSPHPSIAQSVVTLVRPRWPRPSISLM